MGQMDACNSFNVHVTASPGTDVMAMIIKRLDSMDNKLSRLDTIQCSVDSINMRIQTMELKVNELDDKVQALERSRDFDSQTLLEMNKHHKELDSFASKMSKIELEHKSIEIALKSEIQDLKCRRMRDNLLFHKIKEEKDENCEVKILQFIEEKLKIENASSDIRLQRVHRIGQYSAGKTRPIVAKFTDFPDRERVRRAAKELKGSIYGISEQYPKEIVDQRRKLIPIMLQARRDGKEAYLKMDKLYINNQLYRESC
ncbi:uncharacterized protein LOC132744484 [Ruditapes philippinarum]|uniref:uncharacterized protein LOC132744484 n=1 Tax=Ruditapes philippinarum TaxID=129788 RepID=UPI00295AA3A0|nr:uncharacterized protein LOC132744484 [Ruditapes philippinarum]